ncbi:CAP domain-containing protein [Spirilliplanes yamanashiensis]|uniref:SCP domain-containing protein n=1 Tax=Spirilliplanes yamanashiensis TaxID=42233 RepID=A0A8J3YBD4_9ACTN|nr:CAP domain-containing protein [Spirilliplanes yamanashiensis]MDP9818158.1 uncharacterized protein YkwD [Spirilliplanes yamanashiensis]GIJ04969.1 hypothetical protein Sya03_43210 [Spirilliplanes yamanashiensis]
MLTTTTRRLAFLALVPAALFGVLMLASPASAALTSTQTLEQQVVGYTNYQRKAAGCGTPLRVDARLVRAARGHSAHMARTARFSHTGLNGSTFGARAKYHGYAAPLSENIAWGQPTAAKAIHAWLASPGHRRNLLNCNAKAVGVGVVYNARGQAYYTQVFGWR